MQELKFMGFKDFCSNKYRWKYGQKMESEINIGSYFLSRDREVLKEEKLIKQNVLVKRWLQESDRYPA